MNNQTIFRYNASRQVLVEQASVPPCDCMKGLSFCLMPCETSRLLSSLREYPVAPGDWKEDVDYVERKNFEVSNAPCLANGHSFNLYAVFLPAAEPEAKCTHEWVAYTADGKNRYCTTCHLMLNSPPDKIMYSRSELLAEVEKAWDEATKSAEACCYIHSEGRSKSAHVDCLEQENAKEKYFKQNYGVDL